MADRSNRFVGKVVVITGGGKGIGRTTALAFVSEADAGETVRQITAARGKALAVRCDVRGATDVQHLIGQVVRAYGG